MSSVLLGHGWKMEVIDGWRVKHEATEELLIPPGGDPVVTISSPKLNHALSVKDLLYLNREEIQDGHVPAHVQMGDFTGLAFEYTQDGISWWHWDLICGKVWLEIRYDYSLSEHADNRHKVVSMLKTLRAVDDAL